MNKIIREHYPASTLPVELREGIDADSWVRIVVEQEPSRRPMSREELLASLKEARARASGVTIGEAVARIRELRDEWED